MPRFINKKDPNDKTTNGRMIFFSKAPGKNTDANDACQKSDESSQKSEFERIVSESADTSTPPHLRPNPHNEDRYNMITNIIEEEKKELSNIQELIRKRSETLDKAKKTTQRKTRSPSNPSGQTIK